MAFLVGAPLAWAILLLLHPGGEGSEFYPIVKDQVAAWQAVSGDWATTAAEYLRGAAPFTSLDIENAAFRELWPRSLSKTVTDLAHHNQTMDEHDRRRIIHHSGGHHGQQALSRQAI